MASTDTDPALESVNKKSSLQSCCDFLYNKENGTCCGRTGSSWAKIGLFYFIYYICLAAFFAVSLIIFYQTLDDHEPSLTGYASLIKKNPGLSFRPQPIIASTLISFEPGKPKDYEGYVTSIDSIINKYEIQQRDNASFYLDCTIQKNLDKVKDPKSNKVCKFDLNLLKDCYSKSNKGDNESESGSIKYGYPEGKPCVLLKMNRVYDWEPESLNDSTDADSSVQDKMDEVKKSYEYKNDLIHLNDNGVPVTCMGENFGDKENIGELKFYPEDGFLKHFFPYRNKEHYQAPLVMVQFIDLVPYVPVNVWCKAWAANIKNDHKNDKSGSTHFEIYRGKTD